MSGVLHNTTIEGPRVHPHGADLILLPLSISTAVSGWRPVLYSSETLTIDAETSWTSPERPYEMADFIISIQRQDGQHSPRILLLREKGSHLRNAGMICSSNCSRVLRQVKTGTHTHFKHGPLDTVFKMMLGMSESVEPHSADDESQTRLQPSKS